MANHRGLLKRLGACEKAVTWYEGRDSAQAWAECGRGDWMLWVADKLNVDCKLIVAATCDCVEPSLVHVPDNEGGPRNAIETGRAWVRGDATLEDVRKAVDATFDARAAARAARAAARTAYAARAAALAVADAALAAAHAAARTAYVADATDVARADSLRRSAEIVRSHVPWEVIHEAIEAAEAAGGEDETLD